jgi:hypothetical protein
MENTNNNIDWNRVQEVKSSILYWNQARYSGRGSVLVQEADNVLCGIEIKLGINVGCEAELRDDFITAVITSVRRYKSVSEKQAFCLAKFFVKNNIN